MHITHRVNQTLLTIHSVPSEIGGILGSENGIITEICFDEGSVTTERAIYEPNTSFLNEQIRAWCEKEIRFAGIFHTHPEGQETLSYADKIYIFDIMNKMEGFADTLFFPIVIPRKKIIVYYAEKKNSVISIKNDKLNIIL